MTENYTIKEGEFQMGSLVSKEINNFKKCQDKIKKANELKTKFEDQLCNSSPEAIIEEIRSKVLTRGGKAFATLIS